MKGRASRGLEYITHKEKQIYKSGPARPDIEEIFPILEKDIRHALIERANVPT